MISFEVSSQPALGIFTLDLRPILKQKSRPVLRLNKGKFETVKKGRSEEVYQPSSISKLEEISGNLFQD